MCWTHRRMGLSAELSKRVLLSDGVVLVVEDLDCLLPILPDYPERIIGVVVVLGDELKLLELGGACSLLHWPRGQDELL